MAQGSGVKCLAPDMTTLEGSLFDILLHMAYHRNSFPEHSWNLHGRLIEWFVSIIYTGTMWHPSYTGMASNHYHLVGAAKNIRDVFLS